MRIDKILFLAFLVHCGSDPQNQGKPIDTFENDWETQGLVEYIPPHIQDIEQAVGLKNGLTVQDFKDIHFLKGSKTDINHACNQATANACNYPEIHVIIMVESYQNLCVLLAHELTHIALFKTTGNARNDHMNEQFEQNFDLCDQLHLNIPEES